MALAWARIAGWMRTVGHVTPTATPSVDVRSASAPSTDQTKGEWPCESTHGWKWSEIVTKSKPCSSASEAMSTRRRGGCSSLESVSPKRIGVSMRACYPPSGSARRPSPVDRSP